MYRSFTHTTDNCHMAGDSFSLSAIREESTRGERYVRDEEGKAREWLSLSEMTVIGTGHMGCRVGGN